MKKQFLPLVAICALASLSFYSLNHNQIMSKIDLSDYDKAWEVVDSLEREGLPESALKHVEAIVDRAKKEKDTPQIIKSLLYRGKFQSQLEEDGLVKAIQRMELEIAAAAYPTKPILQSIQAELFSRYLRNNQWKLRDRTETVGFELKDVQTWSIPQLIEQSRLLYLASIANDQTKEAAITDFEILTGDRVNAAHLRPTLFDLLAHRAIDYFKNDRNTVTDPSYQFYIDQENAFAPAEAFSKSQFETKDSTSAKYQTILVLQKLLATHSQSKNVAALIDADLKRLKFVYDNAILPNKETLYIDALTALRTAYKEQEISTEITFQLAEVYQQKGQKYKNNLPTEGKWDWKKAYDLCQEAIDQFPNSFGAKKCHNLIATLSHKHLGLQVEQVNTPNQAILAALSFRNVSTAHIKVVSIAYQEQQKLQNQPNHKIITALNAKPILQSQVVNLPEEGDYRQHTAEFDIGALPVGNYAVLISDNADFKYEGHAVGFTFLPVSNIAFLFKSTTTGQAEFVLVDRTTGEPLVGVQAELYAREYNASSRKHNFNKIATQLSDKNGLIRPDVPTNTHFQIKLIKGADVLYLADVFSCYPNRAYQGPTNTHTHFFLDRAIYRPGQTVHFKGIVIQREVKGMPSIVTNKKVTIRFLDVNNQEVKSLDLTTNEYGTIAGTFIAPKTGLMGSMRLESSAGGNQYFSVEEYKRPKFEVTFDPIKSTFKLEDTIEVKGKALAFAGNSIDGSMVQYRVVRQVRFPYQPYYFWRRPNPFNRADMEITNGTTTTNADGSFSISFEAIPDLSIPAEKQPEFTYKVYADVTDITGETQSSETKVSVGYIALSIKIPLAEKISKTEDATLPIISKNLAGEFAPAKGKIIIEALKTPAIAYKKRQWDRPDTYILSEEVFKQKFKNIPYKSENEVPNWTVKKVVDSFNFNTLQKVKLSLPLSKMDAGQYRLTLTTADKAGTPIEVVKYFEVYDLKKKNLATNQIDWLKHPEQTFEPGEKASVYLTSALAPLQVLVETEKEGIIVDRYWKKIKGIEKIEFNINEKDRGNFHYHISFIKNNRSYNFTNTIKVPWSNKELTIEYATFRDKLLPGQEEEWQIKIAGPKKEKIAAEMVAGMYDASLDQFAENKWNLDLYPTAEYARSGWQVRGFSTSNTRLIAKKWQPAYGDNESRVYPYLNWFGFSGYSSHRYGRSKGRMAKASRRMPSAEDATMMSAAPEPEVMEMASMSMDQVQVTGNQITKEVEENTSDDTANTPPPIRTNLKETVFFFPDLKTDAEGNILIKFKMNEALTRWKFLGLVHTKDLKIASTQKEIVTQKELMISPNAPRFFREGDVMEFSAKVSNLSEKSLSGIATIELLDALTMQPINHLLSITEAAMPFEVAAGQSAPVSWKIKVPIGKVSAITHRVVCKAGNYADGEESTVPVLTNRQLVTESKPLAVRGKQSKTFTLESLKDMKNSSSLQAHQYTLEFTSNPAWYAVQALPYLMEYPYDCTEQIFSRFYANTLASSVANAHPEIKAIFEQWKGENSDALKSNLTKNQDLKSALLAETPWVLNAESEEEQKKNIGLLFDLTRMAEEQTAAITKINERQLANGGFAWFPGGRDNWYITQHLVEGMGHLNKLNAYDIGAESGLDEMLVNALQYIDERAAEAYTALKKRKNINLKEDHLSNLMIHYLYTRSFFPNIEIAATTKEAHKYYVSQAEKHWLNKGIYQQGMIGLALNRLNTSNIPLSVAKSLKERAIKSEELGMYWKQPRGYYWHQLPMETHAIMIELFEEVAKDKAAVNELKIWLLKNKQTNHWKTTKATSSVVYALLLSGDNWLTEQEQVAIQLGTTTAYKSKISSAQSTPEAGTGYFKTSWNGAAVSSDMATIKVNNPNDQPVWGAVYWQYFEDLDKIKTFEETPLTIKKQLFKEVASDTGPKLKAISEKTTLSPGDKVKVRIEIRVDRSMEYVHLKDTRASGFEPINVISSYKWQGGLGYYESTGDAATNFFIGHLPKGTFVFEYPLRVVHKGEFSNGITSMQCMYAPEFSSHSEGIRVKVE